MQACAAHSVAGQPLVHVVHHNTNLCAACQSLGVIAVDDLSHSCRSFESRVSITHVHHSGFTGFWLLLLQCPHLVQAKDTNEE